MHSELIVMNYSYKKILNVLCRVEDEVTTCHMDKDKSASELVATG